MKFNYIYSINANFFKSFLQIQILFTLKRKTTILRARVGGGYNFYLKNNHPKINMFNGQIFGDVKFKQFQIAKASIARVAIIPI